MAAVLIRPHLGQRSRWRLFVLQVLMLSLFLTLLTRLWYIQILSGEAYQAQAADQSVRELVVQPARGLIVDDMGRPLVANRTSWVVSLDRTLFHKLGEAERDQLLHRVARAVKEPYRKVRARSLICGEPGSTQGTCWNGSPYQPVPIAEDVSQKVAVTILESCTAGSVGPGWPECRSASPIRTVDQSEPSGRATDPCSRLRISAS